MPKSRLADKGLEFITLGHSVCHQCAYVTEKGGKCKAFPEGIPPEILSGNVEHFVHYEGDHGLKFKQRKQGGE